MILVASGTGIVGSRAAQRLAERGVPVRAMVRGGEDRAEAAPLKAAGVEIVDADVTKPATLLPACADVGTVVCTITSISSPTPDSLRRVDLEGVEALIEAAERAGVKRFVYVSYSPNVKTESPLGVAKRTCERRLRESLMEDVVLQPSYFMEVWLGPALGFDPAARKARIYGSGDTPASYISAFDVAEFAVEAALQGRPDPVLPIGGPRALTQHEVVNIFERTLGTSFELEHVPLQALEQMYRTAGDPVQQAYAALTLSYAQGDPIPEAKANALRYGITLRTVEDYAESFREAAV